jgi:hypothetical protein
LKAGLKINATKPFFGLPELDFFGYWITRDGIQPPPKKVEAIHAIAPPKNNVCNFYRDMWQRRAEFLSPLAQMGVDSSSPTGLL